jgi:multidrug efflux pump subunit AcrB
MNYANIYLKNEFARVPGVADVRVIGLGETAFRVFVNPDRMRAYKLGAGDLIDALRKNAEVSAGGSIGTKERRYTVMTSGRLTKLEQFENVVLRANPEGEVLRLKDVAKVEFSATTSGFARVNGKPAALIAVSAWPGRVSADKFYKAEALAELPPGMSFDVVADRSADRFLTVDVLMPYLPIERIEKAVAQATDSISALPGKPNTVAFAEGREPTATTILIKTPANGGPTVADVQKALADIPDLASRIDVAPPGRDAFPIRIALMDPRELLDASEPNQLRFNEVLDRVVTGLLKDNSIDHSMILYSPDIPKYAIDVDRDKCAMRGVQLDELSSTLQMVLEGVHATDFHKYGQAWKVIVQAAPQYTRFKEDLENLFVRNDRGDMVPLVAVVKIRRAQSPAEVFRVNGYRAAIITAAPAGGKTPAEAAARCVKLAQEILPKGYRVMDLTGQ